jgi:hypothetical protein
LTSHQKQWRPEERGMNSGRKTKQKLNPRMRWTVKTLKNKDEIKIFSGK